MLPVEVALLAGRALSALRYLVYLKWLACRSTYEIKSHQNVGIRFVNVVLFAELFSASSQGVKRAWMIGGISDGLIALTMILW